MRLTEKNGCNKKGVAIYQLQNKLKELEDIEDRLNCGLLKLEEVSKTWKIYSTWLKDYMRVINIVIWEEATRPYITCLYSGNGKTKEKIIFIDQYLETWALTKEELL